MKIRLLNTYKHLGHNEVFQIVPELRAQPILNGAGLWPPHSSKQAPTCQFPAWVHSDRTGCGLRKGECADAALPSRAWLGRDFNGEPVGLLM